MTATIRCIDIMHRARMWPSEDAVRQIISSYVSKYGLVRHQKESFEYFCTTLLPRIVKENSTVHSESATDSHCLEFENVTVGRPTSRESDGFVRESHSCQEVILRGLTYSSPVLVDVKYTVRSKLSSEVKTTIYRNLELCRLPMMTKTLLCQSSANESAAAVMCAYEHGGYFVVNASEKGMISQEKLAVNFPFVWAPKGGSSKIYCAEIRSCHRDKLRSTSTVYINYKEGTAGQLSTVSVQIPFLEVAIHIYDVFILLGATEDSIDDIICDKTDTVMRSLLSTIASTRKERRTKDELIQHLCTHGTMEKDVEKREQYVHHILTNEFLPHQGLTDDEQTLKQKRIYLAYMVRRLLGVILKRIEPDDRDNYCNKRVDCSGMLCSLLFRQLYRHYLKMLQMQVHKCIEHNKEVDVVQVITARKISAGLNYGFATGAWGMQKGGSQTTGVVQIINRNSFVSALANLRRVNTPVNKDSKSSSVRQLHSTSWGVICPTESPEGQACGLVKNLSLLAHVRVGTDYDIIKRVIEQHHLLYTSVTSVQSEHYQNRKSLFVNGIFEGWVNDEQLLLAELRKERLQKVLPFDTTIASTERGVIVTSDPGALCRPLFYVPKLHLAAAIVAQVDPSELFAALVDANVIAYLEKTEEQTLRVALDAQDLSASYTDYAEIHPSLILGLCTSLIPFPHFNQSPRNVYQAAMGKQSCSVWASNMQERFDTVAYGLMYPQKALCHTWAESTLGLTRIPAGQNFTVTIGCWGYNQEDSIIMNQGFIDRGGGRAYVKRSYSEQETPSGTDVFKIGVPPETSVGRKFANYDKLDPKTGIIKVGTTVENGDILVGKTVESYEVGTSNRVVVDCSLGFKHDSAKVESVVKTANKDGMPFVRIRTSSLRLPCIGDKFTSRHGQKGVVGKIERSENMPYVEETGLIPDIMINCHCIPSRMTIGHLLEMLAGSGATIRGTFADCTAFRDVSIEHFADVLEEVHGKEKRYGNYTMVKNGQRLKEKFFVGQIYYQRLKHMSCDKKHGRQRGPVALVTRQPLEGRSRDGGLKLGEMEQQCLLAHGVATMLQERLFWQSDPNITPVCRRCGLIAEPRCFDKHSRKKAAGLGDAPYCRSCNSREFISNVRIPFAFKVFLQELYTMHVVPRLRITSGGS